MGCRSRTNGSVAANVQSDLENQRRSIESALQDMDNAIEYAGDEIETIEDELAEKDEEITTLETQLEELHDKLQGSDREDFLRVLRNIRVYLNDNINRLEAKDGDNTENEETPQEHGGEQPKKGQ